MKKSFLIQLFTVACLYLPGLSFSQQSDTTCRVLLKEISGSYTGGCRNGLAEGKGTSKGQDMYSGSFRHGLPDGKGVYTYQNGNVYSGSWKNGLKDGKGKFRLISDGKSMFISGYWSKGEYVGNAPAEVDYRITLKSGIDYCSVKRSDEKENTIELSFEKTLKKYIPADLKLSTSSGQQMVKNFSVLIFNYNLPFSGTLHFTIPGAGGDWQCNLGFDILKPGKYEVFISNN